MENWKKLYSHQSGVRFLYFDNTVVISIYEQQICFITPIKNDIFDKSLTTSFNSINSHYYSLNEVLVEGLNEGLDEVLKKREMIVCSKEMCLIVHITTNDILFVFDDLMFNEQIIAAEFTSSNKFIVICTTNRLIYCNREQKRMIKSVVFAEVFKTLKIQNENICSFAVSKVREFECSIGLDNNQMIFIEAEQPANWF